jgi:RHS repeat-associated protein
MSARRSHIMQQREEGPMTTAMRRWETRATRGAFMSGLALLLVTLGVLAMTATPIAAQSLKRGPVMIETHRTDLAGNIRLSTNEAGDVTQRLDCAPFGEIIGASCNGGGDPTLSPKFQGKLRDPKTCLDDFGARDYYMVTGRFQSVDPVLPVETALRDPQQWNRYAYDRNNPLIYTDPDGREVRGDEECPACPAAIAAAAAPEATAAVTATVVATARVWGPTLVNAAQALALKAAQFFSSPTGQEVIQAGAELVTGAELGPGGVPNVGGLATKGELTVYRVFGGDARAQGFSWTTVDPRSISNFRDGAGLPSGGPSGATNTADFLVEGWVSVSDVIKSRSALPLDGNKGGLPELIIDPKNVRITGVSVLKP